MQIQIIKYYDITFKYQFPLKNYFIETMIAILNCRNG